MIVVKKNLTLLANQKNVYNHKVNGKVDTDEFFYLFKISLNRNTHFLADVIKNEYSTQKIFDKKISIVKFKGYSLVTTVDVNDGKIYLNSTQFSKMNISSLQPKYVYSLMVYAWYFKKIIDNKNRFNEHHLTPFVSFFTSLFVRVFGRQYGLMGHKSHKILEMQYLITFYLSISFFGLSIKKAHDISESMSGIGSDKFKTAGEMYDFKNPDALIDALNYYKIMDGLNKYIFMKRILSLFTVEFVPAFEDFSRSLAIMNTSLIGGGVLPNFIYTYNTTQFTKFVKMVDIIK